ncbi:uncharacterized protein [Montipora foliosa]|uniref:uncharacterized protein n=1 Tax=Montipora foliosa TaxID=591990 RepID=UPI0035F20B86
MEKFPVFDFASKVKTLDLTQGRIKIIRQKEVKAYKNLENLFIADNPLDCSHPSTAIILKHFQKGNTQLKSFDGHKIKCQGKLLPKAAAHIVAPPLVVHHGTPYAGWSGVFYHHGQHNYGSLNRGVAVGFGFLIIMIMTVVFGACWVVVSKTRRTCSACQLDLINGDPLSRMEKGEVVKNTETPAHALMEGLKKQRRSSQGYPENAILDSDDGDVVEQEEYLRQKMKKQRRMSQGYADGYKSTDDEATVVEIQTKEDLCTQRK